jgi:LacI family transcriptional regulator
MRIYGSMGRRESVSKPKRPIAFVHNSTMMDVAREAGVSKATVSRVINNQGYISLETRERVTLAMEKLGYALNIQARSLTGGASQIIGLLATHLGSEYVIEILRGIDDVLKTNQYDLMLYNTYAQKNRELVYAAKFTRHDIDGILLILPQHVQSYLDTLCRFPHVLIDYYSDTGNSPSIGAANFQGAHEAIDYLLQLGHRRIGFITGNMETGCAQQRLEGYRTALKEHQIPEDPHLVCEGDFTLPGGYQKSHNLLSQPNPPTAIFASNDAMALGVMDAARERGLQLPEDLSIIGFDDLYLAKHAYLRLTTVRQPLEEMGRRAATLLLRYITEPDVEIEHIELPTKLILRESCQAPHI